jgi:hypothetical protein
MNSATEPTADGSFSNLGPNYLCSGLIPATTTSYRITGLQNGIWYGVGVAAVDRYGNVGAISDIVYATPSAGTERTGGSGCSIDGRGKHDRSETAVVLCLAVATLAFARRKRTAVCPPKAH